MILQVAVKISEDQAAMLAELGVNVHDPDVGRQLAGALMWWAMCRQDDLRKERAR